VTHAPGELEAAKEYILYLEQHSTLERLQLEKQVRDKNLALRAASMCVIANYLRLKLFLLFDVRAYLCNEFVSSRKPLRAEMNQRLRGPLPIRIYLMYSRLMHGLSQHACPLSATNPLCSGRTQAT
jgi:hypothetical protein